MAIEECGKPVIGVAHNKTVGGAIDLLSWCDVRYCTADTEIISKEIDIGFAADIGSIQRLTKICGNESWVREMAYSARWANAEECLKNGFFSKIF